MTTILQERKELENFNKGFLSFSEKNKKLVELKKSFYDKMIHCHNNKTLKVEERVRKTKTFYLALLRTSNLSHEVFNRMIFIIKKDLDKINLELDSNQNMDTSGLTNEERRTFEGLENNMNIFLENIKITLNSILYEKQQNIHILEDKILRERELIKTLGEKPETFFEELNVETQIEALQSEEENLEQIINEKILKLIKVSENFLGKGNNNLQGDIRIYDKFLEKLYLDYEQTKKDSAIPMTVLVHKGELLEEHASKFAAIVVGLSGVSLIASLSGFVAAAAIFSSAFGIIATGGEALQALPFMKKHIFPKIDAKITHMLKTNSQAIQEDIEIRKAA